MIPGSKHTNERGPEQKITTVEFGRGKTRTRQGQGKDKARTRTRTKQGPRQTQYVFTNWLREERKEKSYATII